MSLPVFLNLCGGFYVSGFTKDIRERVDYSLFLDKQAAKTTIILNITQFIFLLIPFICCNVVNCTVAAFASNSSGGKIVYFCEAQARVRQGSARDGP